MSLLQLVRRAVTPKPHQISWSHPLILGLFLTLFYWGIARVVDVSGDGLHYGDLADAFLAGQTYLLKEPPPELIAQDSPRDYAVANRMLEYRDLLLFNGRFYIFYGPVPALLLFVPYKWLTGEQMDIRFAAWLMTTLGTIAIVTLMAMLAKRLAIQNKRFETFFAFILAIGTFIPYQLGQSSYYQVALGGSYLFTGLAFISLTRAFDAPHGQPKWLAAASLCFGLATGCRINFIFSGIILLFLWLMMGRSLSWKHAWWKRGFALGAPFGVCILALAAYNYVRFQNPLSLGIDYQISFNIWPSVSIEASLLNIYLALFHPVPLMAQFPFFRPDRCCPIHIPWWTFGPILPTQEPTYGAFTNAPFLLMLCLTPKLYRFLSRQRPPIGWVIISMLLLAVILPLPAWIWVGTIMRYSVDFVPWLMLVACLSYLYALTYFAGAPRALRFLHIMGITAGLYTLVCGFIIGITGYAVYMGYLRYD